jgi:hypothetical protein
MLNPPCGDRQDPRSLVKRAGIGVGETIAHRGGGIITTIERGHYHHHTFEMKVWTSTHPGRSGVDPALFTVSLADGGSVAESTALAASPALPFKPLRPLQYAEGWLGFSVPRGHAVAKLEYDYDGTICWKVGLTASRSRRIPHDRHARSGHAACDQKEGHDDWQS